MTPANQFASLAMSDANFSSPSPISSSGNESMTPPYGLKILIRDDIWTPEVIQRVASLVFLMTVSLIGNVVVIVKLGPSCYRKWSSSRPSRVHIFIVNLAVGDLTVCCFTMTTEVLFVVFEDGWILGHAACKVLLYIQIVTLASTTFILTAMSYDRYLSICKPLASLPASTQTRQHRMIAIAWMMAFIFATPQLVIFKQVPVGMYADGIIKYKCASRGYTAWWQRKTYFTFLTTYILVLPAILMTFCYANVVLVVWRRSRELSRDNPGLTCLTSSSENVVCLSDARSSARPTDGVTAECAAQGESLSPKELTLVRRHSPNFQLRRSIHDSRAMFRARARTVQLTLGIVCLFIVCWTPYFVVNLVHIWSEYSHKISESVFVFSSTLALVNSALNPLLYGCLNANVCRRHRNQRQTAHHVTAAPASASGVPPSTSFRATVRTANGRYHYQRQIADDFQ